MASNYKSFFRNQSYTIAEIVKNCSEIKKRYNTVTYKISKGKGILDIRLKPSEGSMEYDVRLVVKTGSTNVDVFVVSPNISALNKKRHVPHLYSNGALCLYYPNYDEWNPHESWADTLIPWTCLRLYFFELWIATGEWLGGGIHPGKHRSKASE